VEPEAPPRLAPAVPFPPYAYVPGRHPHPERDPRGHSFGLDDARFGALPSADGPRSQAWLHALDLLNHGYHWEAHAAFEAWWRLAGSHDPRRPLLQGLIKLAAAAVKGREGRPRGVATHARGAAVLLAQAARAGRRILGVDPLAAMRLAQSIAAAAAELPADETVDLAIRVTPDSR